MNLRSVDLNLLVVLGVRLEEAHVSRAALRLGMSQPAVSNALERCRGLFDDAILERSGTEMHLTAKAERLREPVAALLADAGAIFGIQQPPLSELRGAVRLTMADILNTVLAPALVASVTELAPGIDLIFQPWVSRGDAVAALTGADPTSLSRFFPTWLEAICMSRHCCARSMSSLCGRITRPVRASTSTPGWRGRMSSFRRAAGRSAR
jgi:DNA-binding transcriptional LysR family regulator